MSSSPVDHQATADAILAAWNRGDFSLVQDRLSPDFVRTSPIDEADGLDAFEQLVTDFRTQFPDAQVTVHEIISEGDRAAVTWTFTGTNTGPGDFPPTGKRVDVSGVSVDRWREGKCVEEVVHFDALSFMNQLGLVDMPD